jgi:histone-lysine N-methyltransferase SETMAR
MLQTFGWELLAHPPYSPDMAPTDYHLFLSLSNHLEGKVFDEQKSLETDLQHFFDSKPASFYCDGIHKLPTRWQYILNHDGDYYND